MPRFYLPPEQSSQDPIELAGREAHHALHVLRIRPGDQVTVVDGAGREITGPVLSCTHNQLTIKPLQERRTPPAPTQITLLQAMPKGKLIEAIIQKAAELGVTRVVPLISERVVTRLGPEEGKERGAKLQAVAIEAIKQCGAAWLPKVEDPLTFAQAIQNRAPCELALVGSLAGGSVHPREPLHSFYRRSGRLPGSIAIWIGPEGDFSPDELNQIVSTGAVPITLGPLVLRSETAAVYCLSFLRYELEISPSASWAADRATR